MDVKEKLNSLAQAVGYDTRKRHIFFCVGGNCASKERAEELWVFLKAKIKEACPDLANSTISRTKADCFRICKEGPIALVYPEGTLYSNLNEKRIERIVKEHLVEGRPIDEWIFHKKEI